MSVKRIDALSADILDEDFIKIFQPLHFMQTLLGFQRVKIDYKFVTATSVYYKFYSATVYVINVLCLIFKLTHCQNLLRSEVIESQLENVLMLNGFFNTIIAWKNNFYEDNLNSEIYVKLQRIDRELKLRNSKRLNRRLAILSFMLTSSNIIICMGWVTTIYVVMARRFCIALIVTMLFAVSNCNEMTLVFHMILFLIIRISYVNDVLKKHLSSYTANITKSPFWSGRMTKKSSVNGLQELVYGVHSVTEALGDIATLFKFPIFAFVCQQMLCNLAVMESFVNTAKHKASNKSYMTIVLPLIATLAFIIVVLAGTCGYLTAKLKETRKLSLQLKSVVNDDASSTPLRAMDH